MHAVKEFKSKSRELLESELELIEFKLSQGCEAEGVDVRSREEMFEKKYIVLGELEYARLIKRRTGGFLMDNFIFRSSSARLQLSYARKLYFGYFQVYKWLALNM